MTEQAKTLTRLTCDWCGAMQDWFDTADQLDPMLDRHVTLKSPGDGWKDLTVNPREGSELLCPQCNEAVHDTRLDRIDTKDRMSNLGPPPYTVEEKVMVVFHDHPQFDTLACIVQSVESFRVDGDLKWLTIMACDQLDEGATIIMNTTTRIQLEGTKKPKPKSDDWVGND